MKKLFSIYIAFFLCIIGCGEGDNNNTITDIITVDPLKANRNVLVVGIDGFRSDIIQQNITPFIYNLSQTNNVYSTQNHITEGITYSGPNWSSMLTGVHMSKHNVTDNSFDNDNYAQYPPFFHYIKKVNASINTVSMVNWTPINTYILSQYADLAPLESMNDSTVFENVKNLLLDSNPMDGDVIFLQFDELDGAGHSYGFSPLVEEYTNTAGILDTYSEELFNIIENRRSNNEDWIYFIISDCYNTRKRLQMIHCLNKNMKNKFKFLVF